MFTATGNSIALQGNALTKLTETFMTLHASLEFDNESNHNFMSCSSFPLPVNELGFALSGNPFPFLTDKITFHYQPSDICQQCHYRDTNINCRVDRNGQIYCPAR